MSPPLMRSGWLPPATKAGLGTVALSVPKMALGAAPLSTRFSAALPTLGMRYSTLLLAPILKLCHW